MRILMLSDVYFPRINGVSTAIQTYRQQLHSAGIDSALIAPRYGDEPAETGVYRLDSWTVPFDEEDKIIPPSRFRAEALRIARDFDVIHIHTPFAAHGAGVTAAREIGLPVVASYHTLFEEYLHLYAKFLPRRFTAKLARQISRRQCNELDAVIVPSTSMSERLATYGVTKPMHVLPTGIPLTRFRSGDREAFRRYYQIDPDRFVALYVGRAAYEKNIDFLINAFALALKTQPDMLLLIAGEGPAVESLRSQVEHQRLTNSVRFLGYLKRENELPDCYAAADAFAFASKTETQGLVLLEAMAAGLPVVALAEMGTRDILKPESGAIAPADDLADFAAALTRVAADGALRSTMRTKGLAWAEEWSDVTLTGRLTALYQQLAARRETAGSPAGSTPASTGTDG